MKKMAQIGAGIARQTAQAQDSSIGRGSSAYCAFRISRRPCDVKRQPWRALRVGSTQSIMSTPQRDVVGNLLGFADAHQVARAIRGKARRHVAVISQVSGVRLADREAADGVAGEIEFDKASALSRRRSAMRAALHDAEKRLAGSRRSRVLREIIVAAAARPVRVRSVAASRARGSGGSFDAFVEHHDDVRAERDLNLDRFFGRKKMLGAVEVRAESDAFVGDLAQIGEAENLEAAGIGEDRAAART